MNATLDLIDPEIAAADARSEEFLRRVEVERRERSRKLHVARSRVAQAPVPGAKTVILLIACFTTLFSERLDSIQPPSSYSALLRYQTSARPVIHFRLAPSRRIGY